MMQRTGCGSAPPHKCVPGTVLSAEPFPTSFLCAHSSWASLTGEHDHHEVGPHNKGAPQLAPSLTVQCWAAGTSWRDKAALDFWSALYALSQARLVRAFLNKIAPYLHTALRVWAAVQSLLQWCGLRELLGGPLPEALVSIRAGVAGMQCSVWAVLWLAEKHRRWRHKQLAQKWPAKIQRAHIAIRSHWDPESSFEGAGFQPRDEEPFDDKSSSSDGSSSELAPEETTCKVCACCHPLRHPASSR